MKYKNGFKCHKCPEDNGENGCPAWNEIIMTNVVTKENKVTKGCHFQLMPFIMTEAIKASNTSTATAANIKNEIANGFAQIVQAVPGLGKLLAETIEVEVK